MNISDIDTRRFAEDILAGRIRPLGDKVFVIRCTGTDFDVVNGTRRYKVGEIYVPDEYGDWSNFNRILAVGPKCRYVTQDMIGKTAYLPEMDTGLRRIGGEVFSATDELFTFIAED